MELAHLELPGGIAGLQDQALGGPHLGGGRALAAALVVRFFIETGRVTQPDDMPAGPLAGLVAQAQLHLLGDDLLGDLAVGLAQAHIRRAAPAVQLSKAVQAPIGVDVPWALT